MIGLVIVSPQNSIVQRSDLILGYKEKEKERDLTGSRAKTYSVLKNIEVRDYGVDSIWKEQRLNRKSGEYHNREMLWNLTVECLARMNSEQDAFVQTDERSEHLEASDTFFLKDVTMVDDKERVLMVIQKLLSQLLEYGSS
ncbi:unnamed protein product [Ilex paraguariensis]|uniref:Uncharacterized protein n=1 Tax=Ilex paraguariensis TaxID=185542 RepID=A0ABC8USL3_9AQUA